MPLLNAFIIGDDGEHKLQQKIAELTQLLKRRPDTTMVVADDATGELLADERFIQTAFLNQNLHAQAKILVLKKINKLIKRGKEKDECMSPKALEELIKKMNLLLCD